MDRPNNEQLGLLQVLFPDGMIAIDDKMYARFNGSLIHSPLIRTSNFTKVIR